MKTTKKIIAIVLVMMAFASSALFAFEANAISKNDFNAKLAEVQAMFPDGSRRSSWPMGSTCHGYARWISEYVWGHDFANGRGTGWSQLKATESYSYVDSIRVGDVIRFRRAGKDWNHTIFITDVSDNTLTYTDCNSDAASTIRWNQTMSKSAMDTALKLELYKPSNETAKYGYVAQYRDKVERDDNRDTYSGLFAAKIGSGYSLEQARAAAQTVFKKGDFVYVWGWLHDIDGNLLETYSSKVCNMKFFIYRPDGSLAFSYSYKNCCCNWIGQRLDVTGTWKIKSKISGALNGTSTRSIKVQSDATPTYQLDLNSSVDGTKYWDLSGIGTVDVYINGTLIANDCSDFCQSYARGTSYMITDIRTKSGYTYNGSKTISGTLNGNRDISLSFKKAQPSGWSTSFRMKSGAYMNAYDGVNGSKVGRVYPGDVVTVKYIYSSEWMKLSCPWDGGYNKTVYCKVSGFQFKATKYINAYNGVNGNYVGRVYPNDLVTVKTLYNSGWMKCVCPWDGGYNKTIFVKVGDIY